MWRRIIWSLAVVILAVVTIRAAAVAAAAPRQRTYDWIAEFAGADAEATTVTVKVNVAGHVVGNIERFEAGDRVLVMWDMLPPRSEVAAQEPPPGTETPARSTPAPITLKTESDRVFHIESHQTMRNNNIDVGYILPAEFVSADSITATLKLRVSAQILQSVLMAQPGDRIRVTSPMSQPSEVAAISAVTPIGKPAVPAAGR